MSKVERQLDEIQGVERVKIVWPFTEEMYLEQIREKLKQEIDAHADRVPLDLRHVHGAPSGLVNLLFDMQQYAESKRKHLVVSYALADMRHALSPGHGHCSGSASERDQVDASESARQALDTQLAPMQSVHHSARAQTNGKESTKVGSANFKVSLGKFRLPKNPRVRSLLNIGLLSFCGTALLVVGYWLYLFKFSPNSVELEPTHKIFEGSSD